MKYHEIPVVVKKKKVTTNPGLKGIMFMFYIKILAGCIWLHVEFLDFLVWLGGFQLDQWRTMFIMSDCLVDWRVIKTYDKPEILWKLLVKLQRSKPLNFKSVFILVVPGIRSFLNLSPCMKWGPAETPWSWTLQNGAKFRFGTARLDKNIIFFLDKCQSCAMLIDIVLEYHQHCEPSKWSNLVYCDAPAQMCPCRGNIKPSSQLHTMLSAFPRC